MARIALIAGLAIGGALLSVATGGLGAFAVGAWATDIIAGASVGAAVGGVIGSLAFPPHTNAYPPLNDLQVQSSAPGNPIPWGYGSYRIAGNIIWASLIRANQASESQGGGKGGPSTQYFYYTVDLAISFGYGPGNISRIWADSKLIYDVTGKGPIAIDTGLLTGNGQNQITAPFQPVIYTGTSTQEPDPDIQAAEGVGVTPAFRDQIYMKLLNFPLSDYGNRVPSFRAEITSASTLAYTKDLFGQSGLTGLYDSPASGPPRTTYMDPKGRVAYALDSANQVMQKIDLDVNQGEPVDPWAPDTVYKPQDQALDTNDNVQTCVRAHTSPDLANEPVWETGEGDYSFQSLSGSTNTWVNVGPGPNAVPIIFQAAMEVPGGTGGGGFNAQAPLSVAVDTAGNLWGTDPLTMSETATLIRFSPITFKSTALINFTAMTLQSPSAMTPIKSAATGKDYLYCTCVDAMASEYSVLVVVDANGASVAAVGPIGPLFGPQSIPGEQPPCVDPATGLCYMVTNTNVGSQYFTTVWVLDPRSGTVVAANSYVLDNSFQATISDIGVCCMWCVTDKTLLVFTSSGAVVKVDPANGNILGVLPAAITSGGDDQQLIAHGYSSVVPSDGILKAQDAASKNIVYIDCVNMVVTQTIPQSNWFPSLGSTSASFTGFAYDPLSNSALVCIGGAYANVSARIYFDRQKVGGAALSAVLDDLWAKAGGAAADLDTSLVSDIIVTGYPITQTSSPKGLITPLCMAYFFDFVESDNKLVAVPRGQSVSTTVPETDMGIMSDAFEAQPTYVQEEDLPRTITLEYYDPALDYQQAKQMFQRNQRVKRTKNISNISVPLTLEADQAADICAIALSTVWSEKNMWEFKLWRAGYLVMDPTDVIQFEYQGNPYQVRITKSSIGQNRVLQLTAVSEDPRQYNAVGNPNSNTNFQSGQITEAAPSILFVLDIPLVSDSDTSAAGLTGYYWQMSSALPGQWPGGQLNLSADNSKFVPGGSSTVAGTYGNVTPATPAPAQLFVWDYTTVINVAMGQGTLSGDTALNVLNGSNIFYLGGELLAFTTATLQSDGSYNLSGLLRGLRGTEGWCSTHVANETFILLNGTATQRGTQNTSVIGILEYFRGITLGTPINSSASQVVTPAGNDLKPYAPAQFTGTVDGSSNINMTWTRRTRVGGAWLDGTGTVPLSEETESYDLLIYNSAGTVLKRTVAGLTSALYQYTAAQQTTDFGTVQSDVYCVLYQNSAAVGHGFPATNPTVGLGNIA